MSVELPEHGTSVELQEDEYIEIIRFGDLQKGDVLIGSGDRAVVTEAYDEHIPETMYSIESADGTVMELSGNHLIYVVTDTDRDLHRNRLKEGRRFGLKATEETIETLLEIAEEQPREVFVAEFGDFMEPKGDALQSVLLRVAESLGPIAESNLYVDNLDRSQKPLYSTSIPYYNSQLFARQLLSLMDVGKARKRWPVVVGTVMEVQELALHDPSTIYIPEPAKIKD